MNPAQVELERWRDSLKDVTPTPEPKPGVAAAKHAYGTLDDVPIPFASNLQQLDKLTTARFEGYHGCVYYGSTALDWPSNSTWGRAVKLGMSEELEMRYWPREALGEMAPETVDLAFLSTRIKHSCGTAEIKTAVLFRPGYANVGSDIEMVDASNALRAVGCRGLHVLMAGLFKRHNPTLGTRISPSYGMLAYDPWGYEALRASTYSVFAKDRKEFDHGSATGATAGPSVFTIAYELLDMQIEETAPRRSAEPITMRRFKEYITGVREDLAATKGKAAAEEAIASAMAIVELLSAEGLMGLRANPFFDGALPDRLAGPHGPALGIAIGMRLAINWHEYGLPKPSACDQYANDQLNLIWATCGMRALPIPQPGTWAIDLVLKAGLSEAAVECEHVRRENGFPASAELNIIGDNKVFWSRLGQAAITRAFGLGAAISPQADSMQQRAELEVGELGPPLCGGVLPPPWRFQDSQQRVRDTLLCAQNVRFEGVDTPLVHLAPPGPRRTALIRLALDCETWLRTGLYKHGTLAPANNPAEPGKSDRVAALAQMLRQVMLPKLATATIATGKSVEGIAAHVLDREINAAAFEHALNSTHIMMVRGPLLHLSQQVGTYVVAPSQCSPCSECEQPVHVLSGIMFKHTYSECTACHAKRCLDCTQNYGKVIAAATKALSEKQSVGPYTIGRKCSKCFAEPAQLCLKYGAARGALAADARCVVDVSLTTRMPKREPGPLKGVGAPSSTGEGPAIDAPPTFNHGTAASTAAADAATSATSAKQSARRRRGNK